VKYIIGIVGWVLFFYCSVSAQNNSQGSANSSTVSTSVPSAASSPSRRVMILVSATDRSGSPAQQLTDRDLSVIDNEQTAEVVSVRSASQLPLRIAFVLLAGKTSFAQQQIAAIDLAHKILRPNVDRAFVLTARGDKPWPSPRLEWQLDADGTEKAVRALDKNAGFADPFAFDMSTEDAGMSRHSTFFHYGETGTSVFDVLWSMMKSDPSPARRAVVIFRDPWAHSTGLWLYRGLTGPRAEQVEDDHLRLIADAQQLWTSFYIVAVEEPKPLSKEFTDIYAPIHTGEGGYNRVYDQNMEKARDRAYNGGKANLERIASETGGGIWWNPKKNYSDAVAGIATQLTSAYAVTYAVHSDPGAGPKHLLAVKSLNSSMRVSVQKGYFSRQAAPPAASAPPPQLQPRPPAPGQNN